MTKASSRTDIRNIFEKTYQENAKAIYRFVYIKTSNKEVAEDLTADIFCKYFEYLQAEQIIENARAMLYRIARNLIIDTYRRKAYRESKTLHGVDMETVSSTEDILSSSVLKEAYEQVRKVMGSIKKEYEDILLLHYIEDMTVPEIAFIQGTNENNVRVKLHRAIKSLRHHMSEKHTL